ncbi:MAG: signal recognition particle-docking protein FtsY [Thermoanaerobaculum sp.]|nr:signal recognition particle-docking protein FtsY [Thermoanaerobaculum sp.]
MQLWQKVRTLMSFSPIAAPDAWLTPQALEEALILADAGLEVAGRVAKALERALAQGRVAPGEELAFVQHELLALFPAPTPIPAGSPQVIFLVGVNGSGKATTADKLAGRVLASGGRPLLAACDTFRAAAVEQLQQWGERLGVPVVAQRPGADAAAVLYDALAAARARGATHVLADTAGRLHTKDTLMRELGKLAKVAGRSVTGAPHQVLLVLDATTGHNGLAQAREFKQHVGVNGLVLSKLDGTAKGGVVLAVARELQLPVYWAGVGEGVEDLIPFDPQAFVAALLGEGSVD